MLHHKFRTRPSVLICFVLRSYSNVFLRGLCVKIDLNAETGELFAEYAESIFYCRFLAAKIKTLLINTAKTA